MGTVCKRPPEDGQPGRLGTGAPKGPGWRGQQRSRGTQTAQEESTNSRKCSNTRLGLGTGDRPLTKGKSPRVNASVSAGKSNGPKSWRAEERRRPRKGVSMGRSVGAGPTGSEERAHAGMFWGCWFWGCRQRLEGGSWWGEGPEPLEKGMGQKEPLCRGEGHRLGAEPWCRAGPGLEGASPRVRRPPGDAA